MHLHTRNVNEAFSHIVGGIHRNTIPTRKSPSRVGDVLMVEEPFIVSYMRPRERVLFNAARDANPFFHLFESLWMLAGRNDVAPLLKYNSKMGDYSDDGEIFNGAYGWRWRHAVADAAPKHVLMFDQLKVIIEELKGNPKSRRCVLQMWNVADDLLRIQDSKDVCCNTNAYFSIRQQEVDVTVWKSYLDMTVCNRSNDLVWGMLGANVVHFSFLQEYMAQCIGVEVGTYHQMTNNLHVYTERWEPEKWLADNSALNSFYETAERQYIPLVKDPLTFDRECVQFINNEDWTRNWEEPFLQEVASPMCWAFELHKRRDYAGAIQAIKLVQSPDWMNAGYQWIQRRKERYVKKDANVYSRDHQA